MDPCHYLRIIISNLSLRLPTTTTTTAAATTSYCCRINFLNFPTQFTTLPGSPHPDPPPPVSAYFTLTRPDMDRLRRKHPPHARNQHAIKIDVYSTRPGGCGFGSGLKLLGRVRVPVELSQQVVEGKGSSVMQNGWVMVGERRRRDLNPELYLSVKAQPDPRFVLEFGGEPECSPQVFQVQGNIRQPVFTCKFSFRHSSSIDSNLRSCSMSEPSTSRSWLTSLKSEKDHHNQTKHKERKGWSLTVHDLSGSPVAAASMVTPFVPSHGSDCVSKSNPGAWLILRPGDGTWKPWGRLEAWRDQAGPAGSTGLGHKFELLPDTGPSSVMGPSGITLAQSTVPARSGGKFSIDITVGPSPAGSPSSSFDLASWSGSGSSGGSENGVGWWPGWMYKGFVMSSTVGGEGKIGGSKPVVEVGAHHVTCTEDAAVFVALAAAMDLSMDACTPFSHKLRKELRHDNDDLVV